MCLISRCGNKRKHYKSDKEVNHNEDYRKIHHAKMIIIPFLTLLFRKEAEQVPMRPMPSSIKDLPASQPRGSADPISEKSGGDGGN